MVNLIFEILFVPLFIVLFTIIYFDIMVYALNFSHNQIDILFFILNLTIAGILFLLNYKLIGIEYFIITIILIIIYGA